MAAVDRRAHGGGAADLGGEATALPFRRARHPSERATIIGFPRCWPAAPTMPRRTRPNPRIRNSPSRDMVARRTRRWRSHAGLAARRSETEAKHAKSDPAMVPEFDALRLNLGTDETATALLLDAGTWTRDRGRDRPGRALRLGLRPRDVGGAIRGRGILAGVRPARMPCRLPGRPVACRARTPRRRGLALSGHGAARRIDAGRRQRGRPRRRC